MSLSDYSCSHRCLGKLEAGILGIWKGKEGNRRTYSPDIKEKRNNSRGNNTEGTDCRLWTKNSIKKEIFEGNKNITPMLLQGLKTTDSSWWFCTWMIIKLLSSWYCMCIWDSSFHLANVHRMKTNWFYCHPSKIPIEKQVCNTRKTAQRSGTHDLHSGIPGSIPITIWFPSTIASNPQESPRVIPTTTRCGSKNKNEMKIKSTSPIPKL